MCASVYMHRHVHAHSDLRTGTLASYTHNVHRMLCTYTHTLHSMKRLSLHAAGFTFEQLLALLYDSGGREHSVSSLSRYVHSSAVNKHLSKNYW